MTTTAASVGNLLSQLEEAVASSDNTRILGVLNEISSNQFSNGDIRSSGIARAVGKLRKNPHPQICATAASVVSNWKRSLDELDNVDEQPVLLSAKSPDLIPIKEFLTSPFQGPSSSERNVSTLHFDSSVIFNEARVRTIRPRSSVFANGDSGHVVYWMSRDQRIHDNWALLKAQQIAKRNNKGLAIVFCLSSSFLGANLRHYGFMLRGLKELEENSTAKNITFLILKGSPVDVLPEFCSQHNVDTIVADFSPLRISKSWKTELAACLDRLSPHTELIEVDSHNIAPCWVVSDKCEFSAKTIRNKIHNAMEMFLTEFPPVEEHSIRFPHCSIDPDMWRTVGEVIDGIDATVQEVSWISSGEYNALSAMKSFLPRLKTYGDIRNDPSIQNGVSNLSPYFHFGQLSVQRVVLEIKRLYKCGNGALFPAGERTTGIHSFCEEAVVRKELSDNFCNFNENYDSIDGAHR